MFCHSLSFLGCLVLATCLAGFDSLQAEPRFARIFGDHAVLQRGKPIPIWGFEASPDSALSLRFGEHEVAVTVEEGGRWEANLPALKASKEGGQLVLLETGRPVATLEEVVVGEVWLAAGQSNLQFTVKGMLRGLPEMQDWVDSADHSRIRFRRIDDPVAGEGEPRPAVDLQANDEAGWVPMSPESVLGFSAVAVSFARNLETELGIPIGLIDVSWGGKPIEPFIPRESFDTPLLRKVKALADRGALEELAALRGGVVIRNPEGHPGAIFDARMAPVAPLGLRGFLWYQAESNAGKGEDPREYRDKMAALFRGWRSAWGDESLPAYFVQLPSFPRGPGWIRVREEQRRALEIPRTGMAVTIDIRGDDIHPPDKVPVGERLARLALADTYGRDDLVPTGPRYREHEVEGKEIVVRFDGAAGGLMVGDRPGTGPVRETDDADLQWFEVAGDDGTWHPARARIEGETVIVSSDAVTAPVAVRYACQVRPQGGNLYNRAGLPASPFCSRLDWLPWDQGEAER